MEVITWGGWDRCLKLVSGDSELVATLDVGPRIVSYKMAGGINILRENPAEMGLTGGSEYRSYGGHRLWIAPEDFERTYIPENEPVRHEMAGGSHVLSPAEDRFGLQRSIEIKPIDGGFELLHRVTNNGPQPNRFAPWALTVMTTGGECLFPLPPHRSHSEDFLPAAPLVLWGYTDFTDPRWTLGKKVVRLRQSDAGPQKVGALVHQGIAVYVLPNVTFVKRFEALKGVEYPDFGCNFETFTRHDMLEVESLGPIKDVLPGETVSLRERWYLLAHQEPPAADAEAGAWLTKLAEQCPL